MFFDILLGRTNVRGSHRQPQPGMAPSTSKQRVIRKSFPVCTQLNGSF